MIRVFNKNRKYCGSLEELEEWKRWRGFKLFSPEVDFLKKSIQVRVTSWAKPRRVDVLSKCLQSAKISR